MNSRQMGPWNMHACRGTELGTFRHQIEAHLLILATFSSLEAAKTLITKTVAVVFGAKVQEARRELGIVGKPRLFSEGAIALTPIVDEALDARSAAGADGEVVGVMAELGELFFKLGLVEVDDEGVLGDGPRIKLARDALKKRGHGDDTLVMKSLAIENILLVWLNFVLSDEEMVAEVPSLAGDQCPPPKRRSPRSNQHNHNSRSSRAGLRTLFLGRVLHGRAGFVPGPPGELLGRRCRRAARSGVVVVNEECRLYVCV